MDLMDRSHSNMRAYQEATGIALRTDPILAARTRTNG